MQYTEIKQIYHIIKTGPNIAQTSVEYIAQSCASIATVTADSMANALNKTELAPEIAKVLVNTGEYYLNPIFSFATSSGDFTGALAGATSRNDLTTHTAQAVSAINQSELPNVLRAAKVFVADPPEKVLRRMPFRLIERMAGDVVTSKTAPSHQATIFSRSAMEKINSYGVGYLTKFFGTYIRMLSANNDVLSPSREELESGMLAIQLANMTWQMRLVVRSIFDLTMEGESTRLQNRQFGSFNDMLSNTYEDHVGRGIEVGLAAVEVALLQDFIESI